MEEKTLARSCHDNSKLNKYQIFQFKILCAWENVNLVKDVGYNF